MFESGKEYAGQEYDHPDGYKAIRWIELPIKVARFTEFEKLKPILRNNSPEISYKFRSWHESFHKVFLRIGSYILHIPRA